MQFEDSNYFKQIIQYKYTQCTVKLRSLKLRF